jgi:hypothetical protein
VAFAPVDYGPRVEADTQGVQAAQQAVAQHDAVFQEARRMGSVIEGGAQAITQGILHTQSLKATAAVKERQAATLQFIDSNPYVPKAVLQQRMTPDDYTAWHAGLASEYQKADAVPMYTAAGALFDSEAGQAREAAGQLIALPGWRTAWGASEQTESATIRERYVNRLAADQMIADHRAQSLMAIDKMVDSAVKPEDIDAAAKAAASSPWLKPAERRFTMEKAMVARDSFVAHQAMLAGDTAVMKVELSKLKSDNAAELYPNMNVKQRLDLSAQLTREYGYKAAKDTAEKDIVGPNVDSEGKVNTTGIIAALAAYDGANKEDVTKAVKVEEAEKLAIFGANMSELQRVVFTAGQNPLTARFSLQRAMRNPDARAAAARLNKNAPGLLDDLARVDDRQQAIETRMTKADQILARAQFIRTSGDNLEQIHKFIDDPVNAPTLLGWTDAQFDSQLYEQDMTEPDRQKARTAFKEFRANGGKADERASTAVSSEIAAAANGNETKTKQMRAKYGDMLLREAHVFIRNNRGLPPDKMTDALRADIKSKLLLGDVVNPGFHFNDRTRLIDWESNPQFAGKVFKLQDGTVLAPTKQRVRLTSPDGTASGTFDASDAAEARAKGWK